MVQKMFRLDTRLDGPALKLANRLWFWDFSVGLALALSAGLAFILFTMLGAWLQG